MAMALKTNSYHSFMSHLNNFDCEIESVARSGCCNYTIAKQIEYVTDKVEFDFVLFLLVQQTKTGISSNKKKKKNKRGNNFNRFNYNTYERLANRPSNKTTNEIQSETISNILYAETRTL